jgi:ribosomal protein S18 acetylase RimI-like enzyme
VHDEDAVSALTLRAAVPADLAALSALAVRAFVAKFGHLYSQANLDAFLAENLSEATFAADLADDTRRIRLAERDGELLAFAKIAFVCGFPDFAQGGRTMELKQLYTAPEAIGGGIGKALMDWAMAELAARGADEVQLSVYAENHDAHRFYERFGFNKVADITFKVGDHYDPEFLFARMLGPGGT